MKTALHTTALALLAAALAVQCSSNTSNGTDTSSAPPNGMNDQTVRAADGSVVNADGTTSTGTANGTDGNAAGHGNTSVMTAQKERTTAASDMRSLRSTLMADLEAVRARLNMGNDPQHEADQKTAADLAQGLERVDRALAAMDAANDSTWAAVREAQLKEVADVRVWLDQYKGSATANK